MLKYSFVASSLFIEDTVLFGITGGDAEAGATAARAVSDDHDAKPKRAVTNVQQPKLTPFVSVTY